MSAPLSIIPCCSSKTMPVCVLAPAAYAVATARSGVVDMKAHCEGGRRGRGPAASARACWGESLIIESRRVRLRWTFLYAAAHEELVLLDEGDWEAAVAHAAVDWEGLGELGQLEYRRVDR